MADLGDKLIAEHEKRSKLVKMHDDMVRKIKNHDQVSDFANVRTAQGKLTQHALTRREERAAMLEQLNVTRQALGLDAIEPEATVAEAGEAAYGARLARDADTKARQQGLGALAADFRPATVDGRPWDPTGRSA